MRLKFPQFLVLLLMIGGLMLGGCSPEKVASNTSPTSTATSNATEASSQSTTEATTVSKTSTESIPGIKDLPRLKGKATVVMTVKGSPITIEVDGDNAPITAGNFVDLVQKGVYDGLVFHRVVLDPQPFVAQGGDPKGNGTGGYIDPKTGSERRIPLEIKPKNAKQPIYGQTITEQPELQHKQGAVAMARSQMPNSASSQFYFALADLGFLDGNYAVFGHVTQGFDVVNKIKQGDKIDSAKVTKGAENLRTSQ
ncbi:peptidylprolyl isomerase [Anabaena sp. PCC 7108]|uniref:peptidylprolyl isomerase n=1 Tax=Anabaena sp. PCC 7108 TaxID=163908 RepID=UPI00034A3185|nr:peptidylprolyl isomerase [Anabaena sp. PCC 7108]